MTTAPRSTSERVQSIIRDTLVAAGFFESVTMSFVDQRLVDGFRPWSQASPLAVDHSSRRQENLLRQTIVPSLLVARRLNESRGRLDSELFELARIYLPAARPGLPDERLHLAIVTGRELGELKGVLENLSERLHCTSPVEWCGLDRPEFACGRCAELRFGGELAGYLGQISQKLVAQFDLRSACLVAELRVDLLEAAAQLIPQYHTLPNMPASQRELSLIVDESVPWSTVESLVRSMAGPHLESIQFLDLYRGQPIPRGRKSLHFGMTFRAADRTLTHDEVEQVQQALMTACKERLGGEIRGE